MTNQTNLETLCRKMLAELDGKNEFYHLSLYNWVERKEFVTAIEMFGKYWNDELKSKYFTPETHAELCEMYEVVKQLP